MSWIQTINYEDADTHLRRIYDRVTGPNDAVDNVLSVHSLRPHTLIGHMTLYKSVLHHTNNELPKWYLEAIGVYVSFLNHCDYCFEHHFAGMSRLLQDDNKADRIRHAIMENSLTGGFEGKYLWGAHYAEKLTLYHHNMNVNDVDSLRNHGFSDGEILELNQVASYFNYVNRSVVGLGVSLQGDLLGLSPSDTNELEDWNHQ